MKKLLLVLLAVITFASCSSDNDKEETVGSYTVTFETEGGAPVPPTQKVEEGSTVAAPTTNPTKSGFVFLFWHVKGASTAYNFQAPVNSDLTLYAKWQEEATVAKNIQMITSNYYHYFVLDASGTLFAFGHNEYGELGTGNNNDLQTLTAVATGVSKVYSGQNTTYIVKTDGSVLGTGLNRSGQLGLGDEENRNSFTPTAINNVKEIAPGELHTFLLKNDGSVWAIGNNFFGQLGVGDRNSRKTFTATNLTSDVVAIAAESSVHTLALKKDGTVWGCGYSNVSGLLGDQFGDYEYVPSFTQIHAGAKGIATGIFQSFILMNDGTVYASGKNEYGQLGVGNTSTPIKSFTQVVDAAGSPLTNVSTIVAKDASSSYALKADGSLWGTGLNNYGQLGLGDLTNRNKFTQVASGIKAMTTGRFHSMLLKNDGSTVTSGHVNPYDQLNGSASIVFKVGNARGEYLTNGHILDAKETHLLSTGPVRSGDNSGFTASVKPGRYHLDLYVSNLDVRHRITGLQVADNEVVTFTYEYDASGLGSYKWVMTRKLAD